MPGAAVAVRTETGQVGGGDVAEHVGVAGQLHDPPGAAAIGGHDLDGTVRCGEPPGGGIVEHGGQRVGAGGVAGHIRSGTGMASSSSTSSSTRSVTCTRPSQDRCRSGSGSLRMWHAS